MASRPSFLPDSTPFPAAYQTASSANISLRVAISPALKAVYPRRTSSTFSAVPMIVHLSVIFVGSCWDGSRVVLAPVAVDGKYAPRTDPPGGPRAGPYRSP